MLMLAANFVNAVMDVRVEQGVFHVTFGETLAKNGGQTEFVPLFRAALPQHDAAGILNFLLAKTEVVTASPKMSNSDKEPDSNDELNDIAPSESRRIVKTGGGEPH